jgi:hypothetical protein
MGFENISPINDNLNNQKDLNKSRKNKEGKKYTRRDAIRKGFTGLAALAVGTSAFKGTEKAIGYAGELKEKLIEKFKPTPEQLQIENEDYQALVQALRSGAKKNGAKEKEIIEDEDVKTVEVTKKEETIKIEETKEDKIIEKQEERETEEKPISLAELLSFGQDEDITLDKNFVEALENQWVKNYSEGGKNYNDLVQAYGKMQPWIRHLKKPFKDKELPENIAYLAIPESSFRLKARSSAGAEGAYQFTRSTGIKFGLTINDEKDERLDPIKSAEACAEYIDYLHKKCGDLDLALSGYNGGFIWEYFKKVKTKKERNYMGFIAHIQDNINNYRKEIKENPEYIHVVKDNETLSKISGEFYISSYITLAKYNNIENPDDIKKDDKIKIPLGDFEHRKKVFEYVAKTKGLIENLNYPAKFNAVEKIIENGELDEIAANYTPPTIKPRQVKGA